MTIFRHTVILFLSLFFSISLFAQSNDIVFNWNTHNLVKYNVGLQNPTYTFSRMPNNSKELSFWSRIQWVGIDNSPSNYILNYSGKFGDSKSAGLGIFQNNTGLFQDTGLVVNYALGIQLSRYSWFSFGLNLSGFRRGLDKSAIVSVEDEPLIDQYQDDFFFTVMPGINLIINQFELGITSDNFYDYNVTDGSTVTDFTHKIVSAQAAYNFKVFSELNLRAFSYAKYIPDTDNQIGLGFLLDDPKYGFVQGNYNSFFGLSGGLGIRLAEGFVVGVLAESGTQQTSRAFGTTYEVIATLELGNKNKQDKPLKFKEGPVANFKEKQQKKNSVAKNERKTKPADLTQKEDLELNTSTIQSMDIAKLDSLEISRDSGEDVLNKIFPNQSNNPRYKAVERIDEVEYGFYLVANVFSQEKYFNLFMDLLKRRGLNPKYFYNEANEYYYVYLKKYDKLAEVEQDRRTNFNGQYFDETWILWVRFN